MGIKYLNQFLKENVKDSIKIISISELSGKKIAVDISIYMYKYLSDNSLIENIYLMLSVFKFYNVIPIFIFDGKPPNEKNELILQRQQDKKTAQIEYKKKTELLNLNPDMNKNDKQQLINKINLLKKKCLYISKTDIINVKKLITAYGATYYDAPREADELCALLTIKGKVFATLSEDMDMFVYGLPKVLRYFSLLNHTAVLYNMKEILKNLGMTQKELREICVLSGTDYNKNNDSNNLYTTLKLFKKYYKSNTTLEFYDWLLENTDSVYDFQSLLKINNMFDLKNYHDIEIENIDIINSDINLFEIKNILNSYNFIFLD